MTSDMDQETHVLTPSLELACCLVMTDTQFARHYLPSTDASFVGGGQDWPVTSSSRADDIGFMTKVTRISHSDVLVFSITTDSFAP